MPREREGAHLGKEAVKSVQQVGMPSQKALHATDHVGGVGPGRSGERGASERGGHRAEPQWNLSAENATVSAFLRTSRS